MNTVCHICWWFKSSWSIFGRTKLKTELRNYHQTEHSTVVTVCLFWVLCCLSNPTLHLVFIVCLHPPVRIQTKGKKHLNSLLWWKYVMQFKIQINALRQIFSTTNSSLCSLVPFLKHQVDWNNKLCLSVGQQSIMRI